MMGGWYDGNVGTWLAMGAMMLFVFGVLLALAVWLTYWLRPRDQAIDSTQRPQAAPTERFPLGEMVTEEDVRARELMRGPSFGRVA